MLARALAQKIQYHTNHHNINHHNNNNHQSNHDNNNIMVITPHTKQYQTMTGAGAGSDRMMMMSNDADR